MVSEFNKRVLIYIPENKLKPTGGMAGYNYNLKLGLEELKAKNYEYLPAQDTIKTKVDSAEDNWFKRTALLWIRILYYFKLLILGGGKARVSLEQYDVVHFHNVKDLFDASKSLKEYKGIVVLTNHSPKPWSSELYDAITDFERKWFGWLYKKMTIVDKVAFERADYIIFPCEDAEEPYYNNWAEYTELHNQNSEKYRYMLTGTKACTGKVEKTEFRKQNKIDLSAFVVSYAGRHNNVKGYDLLCELGKRFQADSNVFFLVAGKYSPQQVPPLENWIEVGWTNDPHSLIAASDVFILPNRETYFDLVMLEVLSLGVIVVASKTGGNKYFEKIKAKGVFLYSTLDEAEQIIHQLQQMSVDERKKLGEENINLYKSLFTLKEFASRYIDIINDFPNKK